MKKTIISWLVNASVTAFAVGALQIPLGEKIMFWFFAFCILAVVSALGFWAKFHSE